jgi:hypothetical protein
MLIIPFGEIEEERFEEARKYNLVEMTAGFWRLTSKCRKNYDPILYIKYLQGRVEREKVKKSSEVSKNIQQEKSKKNPQASKKVVIEGLLDM